MIAEHPETQAELDKIEKIEKALKAEEWGELFKEALKTKEKISFL